MSLISYFLKVIIYLFSFSMSFYAMSAINFEKWIKPNHIRQAQLLYLMCVFALAYLFAEFILAFAYRII